jgi:quercetin dioxygenase-like cupin family protein
VTVWVQAELDPARRAKVAHGEACIAVSVEDMLVVGNVKVTDFLCVTPPAIPQGSHAMSQLIELPPADAGLGPHRHSGPVFGYVLEGRIFFELEGEEPREIVAGEAFWEPGGDVVHYQVANLDSENWSRFFAVCICAPDVDMITMLKPEEIVARDHRRHPAARQYAK